MYGALAPHVVPATSDRRQFLLFTSLPFLLSFSSDQCHTTGSWLCFSCCLSIMTDSSREALALLSLNTPETVLEVLLAPTAAVISQPDEDCCQNCFKFAKGFGLAFSQVTIIWAFLLLKLSQLVVPKKFGINLEITKFGNAWHFSSESYLVNSRHKCHFQTDIEKLTFYISPLWQ